MVVGDSCVVYICVYILSLVYLCFFFQAEDGIRDLVRSRGLGDVYKRQPSGGIITPYSVYPAIKALAEIGEKSTKTLIKVIAVSYTHLTLPTSDLV